MELVHTVEITREAFRAIVGAGFCVAIEEYQLYSIRKFSEMGVILFTVENYVSGVVQYYIQDINA